MTHTVALFIRSIFINTKLFGEFVKTKKTATFFLWAAIDNFNREPLFNGVFYTRVITREINSLFYWKISRNALIRF